MFRKLFLVLLSVFVVGVLRMYAEDANYIPKSVTDEASSLPQKENLNADKGGNTLEAQQAQQSAQTAQPVSATTAAATQVSATSEAIVVTARREPELLSLVPRSVDVITKEQIEDSGTTKLDDLLQTISDITVEKYGGAEGVSGLLMRGASSDQVLVLVDGIPTADVLSNETDLSLINLLDVDRIEVVNGGLSSIYGPNAVAGVVNVITNPDSKKIVDASMSCGSFDTQKETLGLSYKLWNAGISLNGLQERSAGYIPNTDYLKRDFNGKLTYDMDYSNTVLTGSYLNRDAAYPGSISLLDSGREYNENYSIGLDETLDPGFMKIKVSGFQRSEDMTNVEPGWPSTQTKAKETQGSLTGIYDQESFLSIIGGYDFNYKNIVDTSTGTKNIQNNGIMLNASLLPVKALVINAGARYDNNTTYGNMSSWNTGAKYEFPDNTSVHATIDSSFSPPTLDDMFYPVSEYSYYGTSYVYEPNPNLKPEDAVSYEFGVDKKNDMFTESLACFRRNVINLISYSGTYNTAGTIFTDEPINIDKATIMGLEAKAGYNPFSFLAVTGDYTYMEGTATELSTPKPLPYTPTDKISGNMVVSLPYNIKLSLNGEYVDSRLDLTSGSGIALKPYYLFNANAAQKLNDNMKIFCNVSNIFNNTTYQVVYDYQEPGREIMAGMEAQF